MEGAKKNRNQKPDYEREPGSVQGYEPDYEREPGSVQGYEPDYEQEPDSVQGYEPDDKKKSGSVQGYEPDDEKKSGSGKEQTLEEALEEIEGIVARLQQRDIPLEDSFSLYQQGVTLLKQCNAKIDLVEKKMLLLNADGELLPE